MKARNAQPKPQANPREIARELVDRCLSEFGDDPNYLTGDVPYEVSDGGMLDRNARERLIDAVIQRDHYDSQNREGAVGHAMFILGVEFGRRIGGAR